MTAGLPSTVPTLDTTYDAASLAPTGYWIGGDPNGRWVPIPDKTPQWQRDAYGLHLANPLGYADAVDDLLREHARRLERHERNLAMLLWGVHL